MKIYLAAGENHSHSKILVENKVPNILFSWWLLTKGQDNTDRPYQWLKEKYGNRKLFCDSGAASLQKRCTKEMFDSAVVSYGNFLERHGSEFACCAELDIYNLFPKEAINEARAYLRSKSRNILPVWHNNMTMKDWEAFLADYPYVAIGITKEVSIPKMNSLLKIAYDNKIKVHGFAVTSMEKMTSCPFYSVDSTTWLATARYGEYHVMDSSAGIIKKYRSLRKAARSGKINTKNITQKQMRPMNTVMSDSVKTWLNMENYMTKLWEKRGIVWQD